MGEQYEVVRDVTPDECWWLSAVVEAGTVVYRYTGPTYGAIGPGVAVTRAAGQTPFFELPRDALTPSRASDSGAVGE